MRTNAQRLKRRRCALRFRSLVFESYEPRRLLTSRTDDTSSFSSSSSIEATQVPPGAVLVASALAAASIQAFPLVTAEPLGSFIYSGKVNSSIESAGDSDSFTLTIDAGQTITILMAPSDNKLQPVVELHDANNALLVSATATAAGKSAILETFFVAKAGTYIIEAAAQGGTSGNYSLTIMLNAAVQLTNGTKPANDSFVNAQNIDSSFISLPGAPDEVNRGAVLGNTSQIFDFHAYYAVTLEKGDNATFTVNGSSADAVGLQLFGPNQDLITISDSHFADVMKSIRNYVAPETGTYYLCVTGRTNVDYSVLVTRNASFNIEWDNRYLPTAMSDSHWVAGNVRSGNEDVYDEDWYAVAVEPGAVLTITTNTPSHGPGTLTSTLNPRIALFGDSTFLADGISLGDSKNESIQYQAKQAGTFFIRVWAEANTSGEYILQINGNVAPPTTPFTKGQTWGRGADFFFVDFNRAFLASSLQKEDLLIDGLPIATRVEINDGNSVSFAVPPLAEGLHTLRFADGSIQDLQGVPLTGFSITMRWDLVPPRIINTSIAPAGTAAPGDIAYQIAFNEPVSFNGDVHSAITVKGAAANKAYSAQSYSFNSTRDVMTIEFGSLPEDSYTLTVLAGHYVDTVFTAYIEDQSANVLDGEFNGAFPSGNGNPAGNFVINFKLVAPTSFPPLNVPIPTIIVPTNTLLEREPITLQCAAGDTGTTNEPLTLVWKVYKDGWSAPFASGGNSPSFSFTPDNHGDYRIELTASDDDGGVATVTQTITVANVRPVASNFSVVAQEDMPVTILLKAIDSSTDLTTDNFVIVTPPQHGKLSGSSPNVVYLPTQNYNGEDSFTFEVHDGDLISNVATVSLNVAAVNDAPTFKFVSSNYSVSDENPATKGPALPQTVAGWATNLSAGPPDEVGQSLNFTVTNDNESLFAVQPAVGTDGTLAFTPMPNAHGAAHVFVALGDSGGGSNLSVPALLIIEVKKPHPMHNTTEIGNRNGLDVTGSTSAAPDGLISPGDVIAIVNYINARGAGRIQIAAATGPPYYDVTGDDHVAADDAITIVNYINAHPDQTKMSVEPEALDMTAELTQSDLLGLLSADTAAAQAKRRRLIQ